MTSGVEIAGLVLASIPLVVSALEHYSDGMSALERWWRYKREVNKVVRLLVAEQVLFQGTCERLLNAVVTPTELELLIELPGGARWKDSTLDQRLRRHLGRSYDSYMSCVEDMNAALTGLEARLELDPNEKVCNSNIPEHRTLNETIAAFVGRQLLVQKPDQKDANQFFSWRLSGSSSTIGEK
jgi:hypothetical protein